MEVGIRLHKDRWSKIGLCVSLFNLIWNKSQWNFLCRNPRSGNNREDHMRGEYFNMPGGSNEFYVVWQSIFLPLLAWCGFSQDTPTVEAPARPVSSDRAQCQLFFMPFVNWNILARFPESFSNSNLTLHHKSQKGSCAKNHPPALLIGQEHS